MLGMILEVVYSFRGKADMMEDTAEVVVPCVGENYGGTLVIVADRMALVELDRSART